MATEENKINKVIGERIKKLRIERHMSQISLADKMGNIGASAISKMESGKTYISIEQVEKLTKIFHVSRDYLYGDTECKKTIRTDNTDEVYDLIKNLFLCMVDISATYLDENNKNRLLACLTYNLKKK